MKQSFAKNSAFTLVELSVVLVIIGILILGVMKGLSLLSASRLANARSFTAKSIVPQISGLVAWYETSSVNSIPASQISNQSQVTTWNDISPSSIAQFRNRLSRSASSDVVYVTEGINKAPSLQFSGSGSLNLANFYQGNSAQSTIFAVVRPIGALSTTAKIILDSNSSGSTASIGLKSSAVNLNAGSSADASASFSAAASYVIAVYFNGANSGAYVNNATSLAGASNVNPGSNQLSGLTIGTDKSGSNGANFLLSEIIIFNRPLNLQERKDVMTYLAKKYQIRVSGI